MEILVLPIWITTWHGRELPRRQAADSRVRVRGSLTKGTTEGSPGLNDFGNTGYGGPMPPEGHGVHHYYFWILALERPLDLPPGLSMSELLEKTEPYLLGINRLVGTYQRG